SDLGEAGGKVAAPAAVGRRRVGPRGRWRRGEGFGSFSYAAERSLREVGAEGSSEKSYAAGSACAPRTSAMCLTCAGERGQAPTIARSSMPPIFFANRTYLAGMSYLTATRSVSRSNPTSL